MCGEPIVRYVKNFDLYSCRLGKAALMISPPILCPMKLIRAMQTEGQKLKMYCLTSDASLWPISMMSPSVFSSFELESITTESGKVKAIWFLKSRMSADVP